MEYLFPDRSDTKNRQIRSYLHTFLFMKFLFSMVHLLVWVGLAGQSPVPYDTLVAIKQVTAHFAFGKDDLAPAAMDSLRWLIADEVAVTDRWIDIIAHTDSIGTVRANRALAQRRANTAADFLRSQDWPADRIRKTAVGEGEPVRVNDTEEGRQANRRAMVMLLKRRLLTTIHGRIQDDSTGQALIAPVHILARDWQDTVLSNSEGLFSYTLPAGEVVRIDVRRPGHFFSSQMLKAMPGLSPLEIRMKPVVPGARADIQNLYFYGDQATLLPRSEPEIPVLCSFMTLNPTMIVEIAGHVNVPWSPPVDSTTQSFKLSMQRAKLIYDELIQRGVSPHRLSYQAYGNWEMRFPKATTERQQELNRRVEFRILSTGEVISKKEPLYVPEEDGK